MRPHVLLVAVICVLLPILTTVSAKEKKFGDRINIKEKDMMRKSIVYDKNTPDVFYCPMQKPATMNKLIVKSRPLYKLCEFEGKPLPADYKSDCYQDIDESDYACKEKYRIMMRQYPPGSDAPYNGTRLKRFMDLDKEVRLRMEKPSKAVEFLDLVTSHK